MKKFIAWLLVLTLTAAVSIGATLAYLTDTDEDVNVMTLGKVKIDQLEYERIDDETANEDAKVQEFHDNKPLLPAVTDKNFDYTPGDTYVDWTQIGKDGYTSDIWDPSKINNEQDKMVFIKNKGDYDAFVRTVFAFEAGKYTTLSEFRNMVHLNLNETDYTWEWVETPVEIPNAEGGTTKYFVATATYNKVLAPGALTEISLSQIALDKTATNEDVEAFGETYQILVKSQGIQADGFDNAIMALNEGFDMIDASNIPWETDAPTKGGTVYNALHYLNADVNDTNISKNVKNVVFGLNQNYAQITSTYAGALVDVEQDIPVYAYYVPNGDSYDVYLLANDKIYTPKNSTELFQGMTALVSIDTTNMETGRTEIFTGFLKDCNALTTVTGIENWDTSKATMMDQMFNNCLVLDNLDLKKWNVTNVTNMKNMFRYCCALKNFDASTWYLPNVGDMAQMFLNCQSLEELDINSWGLGKAWRLYATFGSCGKLKIVNVADWDTTSITDMTGAFQFCVNLESIDVSKWDVSNTTNTSHMFRACTSLTELDIADWDVRNVTAFNSMFSGNGSNAMDMKLKKLDLSKWQPNSAVHLNHMFYGCAQLTELDLSDWNMPNLYTTSHMFADCINLEVIDVSGWQTSDAWLSMDAMFNDCRKVKTLDVSSWTTSGVTEFSQVFEACWALEEIKGLENWDTSSGRSFDQTFLSCGSLKELNLSGWNTHNAMYGNKHLNGDISQGFWQTFNGVNKLQKLVLGENFDFDGNGTVTHKASLPNPIAKEGYVAKWQNADTKQLYLASEIPGGVAATYVPYYEYPAKGATMNNALHYLNADPSSTKITTKVTSVTFGLTEDYAEIANTYTGVLADQEQDGPVYSYYVPNGSNYDVYMLANDTIYAPVNCSNLCNGMSNLVSFNASNLSVSRTTDMTMMFMGCGKLTDVDVSQWDTSNVTSLFATFANCSSLVAPAMENWDTSNVTTFRALFSGCGKLGDMNVTNWDTSSATAMNNMFNGCASMTNLVGTGAWDTSKVLDMGQMFAGCTGLTTLDVADWNVGSVQLFRGTFRGCINLTQLDVSNWDVSSVLEFNSMFSGDGKSMKLTKIDVSNWNPVSATSTAYMFYGCANITAMDLSQWNVPNLGNMYHMFTDCNKLASVNFGVWETNVLWSVDGMFNDCWSLKSVDVSTFNVSNVTEFCQMFEGCSSLEAIIGLENWNTAKGQTFEEMFSGCQSLTELNLSGFNTSSSNANFKSQVNGKNLMLQSFLSGCTGLEKITFGPDFSFDGDGSAPANYVFKMISATNVEGWDGYWYNADTGVAYLPSDIPEQTAATYVAVKPANS